MYSEEVHSAFDNHFEIVTAKRDVFASMAEHKELFEGKKTGYDERHITCSIFSKFKKYLPGTEFIPADNFIEDCREIKDDTEFASMKQAQIITEKVLKTILDVIKD